MSVSVDFARFVLFAVWSSLKSLVVCLTPSFVIPKKNVSEQVALVTGGGNGLGRQLALRLADLGAEVVVWDVDLAGAEETCRMIQDRGRKAHAYFCDVSDRTEVYRIAKQVKCDVGKVDILVNNAGVAMAKSFEDLSDDAISRVYGINVLSHYWTCRAFLPDMVKENKGHVLAVSSVASIIPGPNMSDYCPAKHAVSAFMECLRIELIIQGADRVRATTACPFFMRTDLFSGQLSSWIPYLRPEDCARVIVDGMLRNKDVVVLPTCLSLLRGLKNFMTPRQIAELLLQTGEVKVLHSIRTQGISRVQAHKAAQTALVN